LPPELTKVDAILEEVPLSLREAAEEDEPDQSDDQPPPEAPDDDQDDPQDHEDAAKADTTSPCACHPSSLRDRGVRPPGNDPIPATDQTEKELR